MTTQTVQFIASSGLTITAKLLPLVGGSALYSASAVEGTGDEVGTYTADFTNVAIGNYRIKAFDQTGYRVAEYLVAITAASGTFVAADTLPSQFASAILLNPANLIATNADNTVNIDSSGVTVQNVFQVSAQQAAASLTPGAIPIKRGDTCVVQLLIGSLVNRTNLTLTAKLECQTELPTNTDPTSVFQVNETNGLTILNGTSVGVVSTDASLVVTNASTGAVTLTFKGNSTAKLTIQDIVYDIQAVYAAGPITQGEGSVFITSDVTQATV